MKLKEKQFMPLTVNKCQYSFFVTLQLYITSGINKGLSMYDSVFETFQLNFRIIRLG